MDCDTCNGLLLDCLYDELVAETEAAVRQHLSGCESCNATMERLVRGRRAAGAVAAIEAPAPSGALLAAIGTAAAGPRMVLAGGGPAVASDSNEAPRSRVPRWLQRVGEVAMRRQVAMAAVFLLMIGFGLSYNQLQAPTRPLPTSDDPGPTVIPARPVVSASGPVEGAPASVEGRRPAIRGGAGERAAGHHPTNSRVGAATPAEQSEVAPHGGAAAVLPSPPSPSPLHPQSDEPTRAETPPTVGGSDTVAHISGDRALDRGLPPLTVDSPGSAATDRGPSWVAQRGGGARGRAGSGGGNAVGDGPHGEAERGADSEGWRALQQQGNLASERGQAEVAIEAWRRALAADPPIADRRAIALRLVAALNRERREAEASEVQTQHLSRTTGITDGEAQMPGSSAIATSSRPMPQSRAPAQRRRQAPTAADAVNDLGL